MRIIQIAESLSLGDAIANDVVAIDGLLKADGFNCEIYATNEKNIDKKYLHSIAEPVEKLLQVREEDILLFHHGIANDYIYKLKSINCCKVLVYHNITPPHFFDGLHEGLRNATQRGLDQLVECKDCFDFCIADSEQNKQDLLLYGYSCPIYVCPVLIPFNDYTKEPNQKIIQKYNDGKTNIIFVGRLSPNKKQEDIIHTFAIYKKYYDPEARLFLIGSDGIKEYGDMLREYVKQTGVNDVYITGSIPFTDILAYYHLASVFLCMSEHEGFCVPLIEAMFFHVPIIAYNSTAIPYTLDEAGVVLEKKDYALFAGWIHAIIMNKDYRDEIISIQDERLQSFLYDNVASMFKECLQRIIRENEYEEKQAQDFSVLKNKIKPNANSFSLVMPLKASDWEVAERALPLIWKNINPKQIVVISSEDLIPKLEKVPNIVCLDQDRIVKGLTISNIKKCLKRAGANKSFAGWFLKQFLTYVYSYVCDDEYYVVWDADTLPLRPIRFIDENGVPYFTYKREYVAPYFKTIKTLLNMDKYMPESFISEHQVVCPQYAIEMFSSMEANESIPGKTFWEKAIYACDFSEWNQPFSDYETYGTFVMNKHPESYRLRKLNTFRPALTFFGENPSEEVLEWMAKEFDTASFEHWDEACEWMVKASNDPNVRKNSTAGQFIMNCCEKQKSLADTGNIDEIERYRKLQAKMEFDYFFGDKTVYSENQ